MPRLFTGIPVPLSAASALLHPIPDIAGVRPVVPGNLHLTLHFLGDVEPDQAALLADSLADLPVPVVRLQLNHGGMFGQAGASGVFWIGPQPQDSLQALHQLYQQQRRILQQLGLRCEDRAWHPHITVARFKAIQPDTVQQFLDASRSVSESIDVDRSILWESRPGTQQSVYQVYREYRSGTKQQHA